MDFYRLNQPGSEWLPRQGDAIKAARGFKPGWTKVEVPTNSKPLMLDWLNANARGGGDPEDAPRVEVDQGQDEERFWEVGPKTKNPPRLSPSFLGDERAGVEFVPITKSAAIAASYRGCPKCQRTFVAQVIMGINDCTSDELDSIQRVLDLRRERLSGNDSDS
jgi:hypothetical protein